MICLPGIFSSNLATSAGKMPGYLSVPRTEELEIKDLALTKELLVYYIDLEERKAYLDH